MIAQIRENIFVGDEKVTKEELKINGITIVEIVADDVTFSAYEATVFVIQLKDNAINKPHVKDIACHIPKYMAESGEKVLVISKTGMKRAAFVVARAICEMEQKSIYEVLVEMQGKIEGFDIGKAYL